LQPVEQEDSLDHLFLSKSILNLMGPKDDPLQELHLPLSTKIFLVLKYLNLANVYNCSMQYIPVEHQPLLQEEYR